MKDTENTPKINPEIKEKAEELFDLIEEQWIKDGKTTTTSENLSKEIGDLLVNHRGFEELRYAYLGAAPNSQLASNDLESSTWYMNEDALADFFNLSRAANKVVNLWESYQKDESKANALVTWLDILERNNREIFNVLSLECKNRVIDYRKEIKKLKDN